MHLLAKIGPILAGGVGGCFLAGGELQYAGNSVLPPQWMIESVMRRWLISLVSLLLVSCQTGGGVPGEQPPDPDLGVLESRVEQYREAQQAALEQFESCAQQLSQWSNAGSADLQGLYAATVRANDDSIEAATAVSAALAAMEEAAGTAFQQWQVEVDVYTDTRLKADSQARLGQTWQGYEGMMQALRQSEVKMDNVLAALNANMKYVQANLSAAGIANHQSELQALLSDLQELLRKMTIALDSSEAFLDSTG